MFSPGTNGIVGRTFIDFTIGQGKGNIVRFDKGPTDVILPTREGLLIPTTSTSQSAPVKNTQPSRLDNLVLLLDCSTSMGFKDDLNDSGLDKLKASIEKLGDNLTTEDGRFLLEGSNVHLILFSGSTTIKLDGENISSPDEFKEKVVKQVLALNQRNDLTGGTKIDNAALAVEDAIKKHPSHTSANPGRNLCIFVGDGDHRPKEQSAYKEVYSALNRVAKQNSCYFVSCGLGTNYSSEVLQSMAGFTDGNWSHIPTIEHLKRPAPNKIDLFRDTIPNIIQEITGNDEFIRVDAIGATNVFSVNHSVHEVPFDNNRIAEDIEGMAGSMGLHQLNCGFITDPAYVALLTRRDASHANYRLAIQESSVIDPSTPESLTIPENMGKVLEVLDLPELNHEDRIRAENAIQRLLITLAQGKNDLVALWKLKEVGFITDEQYEAFRDAVGLGEKGVNEEQLRELKDDGSSQHRVVRSDYSGSESFNPSLERPSNLDDFGQRLWDLGKIEPERNVLRDAGAIAHSIPAPDNTLCFRDDMTGRLSLDGPPDPRSRESSGNEMPHEFSGGLGPLDKAPVDELPDVPEVMNPLAYGFSNGELEIKCIEGIENIGPVKAGFINKNLFSVGRHKDCDIRVNSEGTSRLHFTISKIKGEYYITDTGSRNGTYLNGSQERIGGPVKLTGNNTVLITGVQFSVNILDNNEQSPREEPEPPSPEPPASKKWWWPF